MKLFRKDSNMLLRHITVKLKTALQLSVLGFRFTHRRSKIYVEHWKYPMEHQMIAMGYNLNKTSYDYPPIVDMSEEGQKRHFRQLWYDSIKALPSVEQKLFELAVQQKKELNKYQLSSVPPTFNGVKFQNFITRTHMINSLPNFLLSMNVDQELQEIRETLCDSLLNNYLSIWEQNKFKKVSDFLMQPNAGSNLANCLISQCYKKLALRNDYVFNSTIQQKPRIFSFWWHGGFGSEEDEIDEKNLCFQYEDFASFAIRGTQPILPVLDIDDDLCSTPEVPIFQFHPDMHQIPCETIPKLASIPAYWPGDPYEYPFLLVLTSDKFQSLTSKIEFYDIGKIEDGAAIISSFAWLSAIATSQGFTPFHDLTYPLVTHTIVTNGQDWKFYLYQLNTYAFHSDVDKKDRRNLCWSSEKLRLFDTIEDGQVKGINDEVFKLLLKVLHNVPQVREGLDMKPYLGTDTRSLEEIEHTRHLIRKYYSRVPEKMQHLDEVPTWVKIYKLHPDAPPSPFVKLK